MHRLKLGIFVCTHIYLLSIENIFKFVPFYMFSSLKMNLMLNFITSHVELTNLVVYIYWDLQFEMERDQVVSSYKLQQI